MAAGTSTNQINRIEHIVISFLCTGQEAPDEKPAEQPVMHRDLMLYFSLAFFPIAVISSMTTGASGAQTLAFNRLYLLIIRVKRVNMGGMEENHRKLIVCIAVLVRWPRPQSIQRQPSRSFARVAGLSFLHQGG